MSPVNTIWQVPNAGEHAELLMREREAGIDNEVGM